MATVTGYTAERMKDIEDSSIVGGAVDSAGNLILTRHDGSSFDAGQIRYDANFSFTDSPTLDFTVTGSGTPGNPLNVTGDLITIPEGFMVTGILEASYRGGPARVKVNGTVSNDYYNWATPYQPQKSRQVRMIKTGSTWLILGQTEDGYYQLPLATGWTTYADWTQGYSFSRDPRVTKLPSGIVVLSGLLANRSVRAANTLIAQLPDGCWPDGDMMYPVMQNDRAWVVRINSNGQILVFGNSLAQGQYLSLDGIAFPAAGVATWTDIGTNGSSFGANFEANSAWTNYGVPGYWKDPWGYIWFRGMVRVKVATSTDGTILANMPASYRGDKEQHFRIASLGSSQYYGGLALDTAALRWKLNTASAVGDWISLWGVVGCTPEARTNPYYYPAVLANSWANWDGTHPQAGVFRREDGLVLMSGLIGSGTPPSAPFLIPEKEYLPQNGRIVLPGIANNALGRIDVSSSDEIESPYKPGTVTYALGGPWSSLDQKMWVP